MVTKVRKWGNSLAIRLPKEVVAGLNIKEGTGLSIYVDSQGKLVKITPQRKKVPSLTDLMRKVTKKNIHPETDWGRSVGKEV